MNTRAVPTIPRPIVPPPPVPKEARIAKSDTITRKSVLEQAIKIVTVDRELQHGAPENNFKIISDLWTIYKGVDFTPKDAAIMMALLKIARIKSGHNKADNYVDLIGYAACGAELEGME